MTPKEKAQELVDKFINIDIEYIDSIEGNCFMVMSESDAKKCALIAVDEMIKFLKYQWDSIGAYNYYMDYVKCEEVKQEIEAL